MIKVISGDYSEGIEFIEKEDKEVNIVVTSPPYNIDKDYDGYSDDMDLGEYLDWMEKVFSDIKSVLADDGSIFLNISDKPSDEFRSLRVAERLAENYVLQNTIHWTKSIYIDEVGGFGNYSPLRNSDRYIPDTHEYIFHFTKKGDVSLDKMGVGVPQKDLNNIDRFGDGDNDLRERGQNWFIKYEPRRGAKEHPATFPVALPRRVIELHGYDDDTLVFDPFVGSGTTLVACEELGISGVGTDISERYVKLSRDRLNDH